jgi:ketosteroid isomerase-like protein
MFLGIGGPVATALHRRNEIMALDTPVPVQATDAPVLVAGRTLYAALAAGDGGVLTDLLSDDFRGTLTAGLPHGFGRTYEGRDAMMNEGWGAIGAHFALAPQVERLWDGGDVLIARGTYVGHAIETGRPVHAAFAHVWGFDGARFTSVEQVTDSAAWAEALRPAA